MLSSSEGLLEQLKRLVPAIDGEIDRAISSDSHPEFYGGMGYAVSSGGKRLRPAICIMVCEALGGDAKQALPVAAGIELLHNATLVHDDVEDGDRMRRGKPSVWKKYGISRGMNIGDGMIFKAYEAIVDSALDDQKKVDILSKFTATLVELTEGQSMEFEFRGRDDVRVDEYLDMARKKAGVLIGFSVMAGAIVAGASEETQSALYEFGSDMGVAFMIRDDVLNLVGDEREYGKEIGGDIKEGKRTLASIDCLSKCGAEDRAKLLAILKKPRPEVSAADVDYAIGLMRENGSIKSAQGYSESMIEKSTQRLDGLENASLRKMLEGFSEFMIKRTS